MHPAAELAQHLIAGAGAGCLYGLLGLGFGLVYRASRVVNFAHGEVMALGAFCAYSGVEAGFGLASGLALALPVAALASLAIGRLTARIAGDGASLAGIAITAACAVLLRFGIEAMPGWGTETHALASPLLAGRLAWGGVTLAAADLAAIAVTALIVLALAAASRATRLGLALRAYIDDPRAAVLAGVNPARMRDFAWLMAGALAAVAGLLLAPLAFVHSGMGMIAIKGFAAAALFGLDRPAGALAGGLMIGLGETLLAAYMPAGTGELAVYGLLITALALRGRRSNVLSGAQSGGRT